MPGFCGYTGEGWESRGTEVVDDMCKMLVHTGEHQAVRFKTEGLAMAVLAGPEVPSPLPFVDDEAGVAALFEGELYNREEMLREFVGRGMKISRGSSAEVVLHAYQEKGRNIGPFLNGAFNAFLWDKSLRKLTIINDRLGLRPLYFTEIDGDIFFASEVKAFYAVAGFRPSLDHGFLYQFLEYGFPLGEVTMVREVSQMPMATIAEVREGEKRLMPYWGPEHWPAKKEMLPEEAIHGFIDVFSKAQARMLRGDREKGILLSGGIDSRIIAADAVLKGRGLPTFTFGEEGCLDNRIACKVAEELGLSNRFLPIGPDCLVDKSLEACWITDGMFNVFHSHGISIYPEIAEHVKVILTGMEQLSVHLYGDEIRGLPEWSDDLKNPSALFRHMYEQPSVAISNGKDGLLSDSLERRVRGEQERVSDLLSGGVVLDSSGEVDHLRTIEWMGLRHRQRRFTLMGQLIIRNWLEVRTPLMDSDLIQYAMTLPNGLRAEEKPLHVGLLEAEAPQLLKVTLQKTELSPQSTVLDSFLTAGKNWIINKGGNYIARITGSSPSRNKKVLADYHRWLVHDETLQRFVRGILLSQRALDRGLYKRETVQRMLDNEFSDVSVHTELIGRMITLELAMRLFFDGENENVVTR
jgi:asparagine synthase (glutamine-hydrolysing)